MRLGFNKRKFIFKKNDSIVEERFHDMFIKLLELRLLNRIGFALLSIGTNFSVIIEEKYHVQFLIQSHLKMFSEMRSENYICQ